MTTRLVLIDPDERRDVLARRLRSQGFDVDVYEDPAAGANAALAAPPDAVVADLWMPGISGVPLTRLLTSEPATMDVPIILRATSDEPRNRFWARHAGAAAYVAKGRMGELVRALKRLMGRNRDNFFLQLGATADVRDRLSEHLDRALFESVLASEVRALGSVGSFPRLMDLLSQLLVQITTYRWMAIRLNHQRFGVHCRPEHREAHLAEAVGVLDGQPPTDLIVLEDDDAEEGPQDRPPLVAPIVFGGAVLGTLALSPTPRSDADQALVSLVARELGGPVRIVDLVEETQRLATTDTLTGLLRRAPFVERLQEWFDEDLDLSVLLVDLDRFKSINDR
ncbi:MAG: response regulator, partial [Myxococcales bacterium]|nr:response regulator [Myxococcales bacterium]